MVFFATLVGTAYLFVAIPKGFFPQQDTGLITGMSEAAQDISFAEMMRRQEALGEVVAARSRRRHHRHGHRRRRLVPDDQQRPHVHHAEAEGRARRLGRRDHRAAAAEARQGRGRHAVPAGGAGHQRRRPVVAHAVPVHAAGRRSRRAERLGAEGPGQAEDAARAARRGDRPADRRHDADRRHRPRPGGALRHHAAG